MRIPFKYNVRSLLQRRVSTLMTTLSIALVVAIFIAIMALANGLQTALVTTGDALNVQVLRRGSSSELGSAIPREALPFLKYLPGIETAPRGEPKVSPEIVIVLNLPKRGEEQGSNVTIRGLSPSGLELRPQVRIVAGRMFQAGQRELIVSSAISKRFQHTGLGEQLRFGKGDWTVVGIFEAGGTAFDSEMWVDVDQLADDFNRQTYSSATLRAGGEASSKDIIRQIEEDRRYNLTAQPETSYYEEQTRAAIPIKALGFFITTIMGIGACFAAMNTMYAAVAARAKEIATLRALGFKNRSIVMSFLTESLLLSLVGGVVGCLLTLPLNGITTGTTNFTTFSEVSFAFRITPLLLLSGIGFAFLIGLFGGLFPTRHAIRSQRLSG